MRKTLVVTCVLMFFGNTRAQIVTIVHSLTKTPSSSAIAQYNNLFGQWNMPDKDDPFPFAVIRVDLIGDENSVRAAKHKLGFDVGNMQRIESDVRTEPNKIIILVPKEIRNIYLTCGDGCEKQMLYSGGCLESNAVYSCKIEYQNAIPSQNNSNAQILQELQELKKQMAQMQGQNDEIDPTSSNTQVRPFYKQDANSIHVEHEYVDLGLSVKWATCNVGATTPSEYGCYFAWGEIMTKDDISWQSYRWCNGTDRTIIMYCSMNQFGTVDKLTTLQKTEDAANVKWGGNWRMPTVNETRELIKNCSQTWVGDYKGTGVAGRIFTSNVKGYTDKSIFIPAAGFLTKDGPLNIGSGANYWTSSLHPQRSDCAWTFSFFLNFYLEFSPDFTMEDYFYSDFAPRYTAQTIRPVCP